MAVKLAGEAGARGWIVRYFGAHTAGEDITALVTSAEGWRPVLARQDTSFRLEVTPTDATERASLGLLIKAGVGGDSAFDAVRAVTAIKESERPDLAIGAISDVAITEYSGQGLYGSDGANQVVSYPMMIGMMQATAVEIRNTAARSRSFTVLIPTPPAGWTTRLFDAETGGTEISTAAQGWTTPTIAAGATLVVRLEVSPTAAATNYCDTVVTASSGTSVDAVQVKCALQKIAKIQWSRDENTWHDMDDSPIQVEQYEVVSFRAVGTNPSISWDELPGYQVTWTYQGVKSWGESTGVHFPALGATTVTATCGNQKVASVQVSHGPYAFGRPL